MNVEQARFNMIEQQIRTWDVLDQRVLDLLAKLPREDFVPERYRTLAFVDMQIPLDHGQVMLEPRLEARLVQSLDIAPTDRILEIGTGSGYSTALLASLGAHVTSVEIFDDLSRTAGERLAAHGIDNVALVVGDAGRGWEQGGPWDAILLTGSVPILPEAFKRALSVGGRLMAIVGELPVMEARLVRRVSETVWEESSEFDTEAPALLNCEQPSRFVF
jgi:protein-L-isoaspartate(D-aspartate) O-methyltransferase